MAVAVTADTPPGGGDPPRLSRIQAARLRAARRALRASFGTFGDAELAAAVRREEPGAFEAFAKRYSPLLLGYARHGGLPEDECDELVQELLDDVAMRFIASDGELPDDVRPYVLAVCRRRLLRVRRGRERRERLVREAALGAGYDVDRAGRVQAAAACSEYARRAARGPGVEALQTSPMLDRLSAMLDEGLSADERQMLAWESADVPQRVFAEWIGVSYAAVRQRLARLRVRLSEVAARHLAALPLDEQVELRRFLRRCGVRLERPSDAAG